MKALSPEVDSKFEKLKITHSNDMGTWRTKTIMDLMHPEAVTEIKDFLATEIEAAKREELEERLWDFAKKKCDSFDHVGIHRCSYGHCESCGICDVLSELLLSPNEAEKENNVK